VRRSARVIVLDGDGRVLLLRARDSVCADLEWLLLPGGAVEAGETEGEAARRELYEETGLRVDELGPPIAARENTFAFGGRIQRQHEAIYAVRVPRPRPRTDAMVDGEREQHIGYVWWREGAPTGGARLHPPDLAELVEAVQ
jgi:8-oxo-dGTP pyrophosphatase MutT (NUDIX family)